MLKTALKPKWIAALLAALAIATGFVLLSGWQFGASETEPPVKIDKTEKPVALIEHQEVGKELLGIKADQIITMEGEFVPGTDQLISPRLNGEQRGVWVVTEFKVEGADKDAGIAVVRGWQPEATKPAPAPEGELEITGRLLPSEGPEFRVDLRSPTLPTVASAQLANIWDSILYEGFVSAHEITTAKGEAATQAGLELVLVGPQPQGGQINWLNVFYGLEWVLFAGFAIFLWYRMVRDDYQRDLDEIAERAAEAHHKGGNATQADNSNE
ncbi:cytochrome oxidase assembly protein ShyY1 [Glutamicibacter mysorens]|uniref:SURF1-like protein n=1 Tax=Glutamicibacter mysorens TaxID=257984 RepID=A0ABX4MYD0_9MICC|nr:SURF1 family cytochrome oxidase biogenesis protein [Glutamicibacter mysorens]PJJ44410.1 cytochrome oxidase assembly protein ShyY1 [Glutamicibacter mysorens]